MQAWAWFDTAAGQGDEKARDNRKILAASMTADELGRAQKVVLELAMRHGQGSGSSALRSAE